MLDTKIEGKQKRQVTFVSFTFFPLSCLWQCLWEPVHFKVLQISAVPSLFILAIIHSSVWLKIIQRKTLFHPI